MAPDTGELVAQILNDWYIVRHYKRGGRAGGVGRERRQQAVQKLGLTIREAFNRSNDFEALIAAVLDGGRPQDHQPF